MFEIIKAKIFNYSMAQEVIRLNALLDLKKYAKVVKTPVENEFPFKHSNQALKAILVLIALVELKEQPRAEKLANILLFQNGLQAYNVNDRKYLRLYILVILRGEFTSLSSVFSDINIEEPDYETVSETLKNYLTLAVE